MNIRSIRLILMTLLLLMLVACQPRNSSLLEDITCHPPCWHLVYPGQSTQEEVISSLSSNMNLEINSIKERSVTDQISEVTWLFDKDVREKSGRVQLQNDIVVFIRINTGDALQLGEIIERVGEPDLISAISGMADTNWLRIAFLYPSKGIVIIHFKSRFNPKGNFIEVTPNLSLEEVIYFDPPHYEELLYSRKLIREDSEAILNSLQPWSGFGEVSYLDLSQ